MSDNTPEYLITLMYNINVREMETNFSNIFMLQNIFDEFKAHTTKIVNEYITSYGKNDGLSSLNLKLLKYGNYSMSVESAEINGYDHYEFKGPNGNYSWDISVDNKTKNIYCYKDEPKPNPFELRLRI